MEKRNERYTIAREVLLNDGIVAFPTDTVMGFGVNGLSQNAVKNLFELKKREQTKPLYLLAYSITEILEYVELIPGYAYDIMERYLPGPIALIFKSNMKLFTLKDAKGETLGARIPKHPGLVGFLSYLKIPILNTSANISHEKTLLTKKDVINFFGNSVYFVDFDYNIEMSGIPSTIVDCTGCCPKIVREGAIKI